MKKTALLSVYSKEGIVEFAKELKELGWDIISSGGTAGTLDGAGIPVVDVADLVGGKAILGHRVVTISRKIHAGLMARDTEEDREELERLDIPWIDLVCNDLYPLQQEIDNPECTRESVIEKTDVGGPFMLHSAAKGQRIVICDPADRQPVIDWLKLGQPDKEEFITSLAAKAEYVVAKYCLASARYHSKGTYEGMIGERVTTCLYGENAWQTPAGLYTTGSDDPLALSKFEDLAGTDASYNNLTDIDRLIQTITHVAAAFDLNRGFVPCIAIGVKHGNPCGAATGPYPAEVIKKMATGDVRALFGGSVMTNFAIGEKEAEELLRHSSSKKDPQRLDAVLAPYFNEGAIKLLKRKGGKCRIKKNEALVGLNKHSLDSALRLRYARGEEFLVQPNYTYILDLNSPNLVKIGKVSQEQEDGFLLGWAVGSTSNSNTITVIQGLQLIANGTGQQDRVGCCELAIDLRAAGHGTAGAIAYSDSFFPFTDGPEVLVEAGIEAIFASSGSIQDKAVIEYLEEKGVGLYLIPDKEGRGFFGH